ncbi:hypothetical protein GQ53DRAFT_751238 [Thozetella sp. PMI_491]|nr:hypothetical protein GQ53DRAFT_751238 [Thozetella sp. PMI_491]
MRCLRPLSLARLWLLCLATPTAHARFEPSEGVARQNAFQIFNAVHSALRQWGSSLNHNGMSLFLATVPAGNVFYHGAPGPETATGPEWLAFEIEHAEGFAPRLPPSGDDWLPLPPDPVSMRGLSQAPIRYSSVEEDGKRGSEGHETNSSQPNGYLHIYRTTEPLHLLYIDGMGAGKTDLGTLDTQDLLLRDTPSHPMDEGRRADALCALATSWGLDGVIRMEAGFEIIKCDFTKQIELLSAQGRPAESIRHWGDELGVEMLAYMRAASQRYDGVGTHRVRVDWGSMVSALWYPVDLGNPAQVRRQDGQPRLVHLSSMELKGIRQRVEEVVTERAEGNRLAAGGGVDWQSVVDAIVTRYADTLHYMAEKADSVQLMRSEVANLVKIYIDYEKEGPSLDLFYTSCVAHYLSNTRPVTPEDRLVFAAVDEVSRTICAALLDLYGTIVANPEPGERALGKAVAIVRDLMDKLNWTTWQRCTACPRDEVCFLPMWPFGDREDHERPNCKTRYDLRHGMKHMYWR